MTADEVYEQWAKWLVVDTGAPWNWKPDVLPPPQVLRLMPQFMYDHDNRRSDDLSIIHQDVTREDYAGDLREEWGCSTAFMTGEPQGAGLLREEDA